MHSPCPSEYPFVSVIVPTYRDWTCLQRCLDALARQTYPATSCEILVVDNDPAGELPAGFCLPANARYLRESQPGSYAARNSGIAAARGSVLAFTDADCVPRNDWLDSAVRVLLQGTGRVAGRIELFYRHAEPGLVELYESLTAFDQAGYAASGGAVTANMVTWASSFDRAGLFDATLFSGGDNEWGRRADACGLSVVYAEHVVVGHPARSELAQLKAKIRRVEGGAGELARRRAPRALAGWLRALVPPVRFWRTVPVDRLGWRKSLAIGALAYYLKLYRAFWALMFRLRISRPPRA